MERSPPAPKQEAYMGPVKKEATGRGRMGTVLSYAPALSLRGQPDRAENKQDQQTEHFEGEDGFFFFFFFYGFNVQVVVTRED